LCYSLFLPSSLFGAVRKKSRADLYCVEAKTGDSK
jgi:hypothetical protein